MIDSGTWSEEMDDETLHSNQKILFNYQSPKAKVSEKRSNSTYSGSHLNSLGNNDFEPAASEPSEEGRTDQIQPAPTEINKFDSLSEEGQLHQ